MRTKECFTARLAADRFMVAASVEKQNGLLSVRHRIGDRLVKAAADGGQVSRAELVTHIDDLGHGQKRAAVTLCERNERIFPRLRLVIAFYRGRSGCKQGERAMLARAKRRNVTRVITGGCVGFVGMLMLLVDEDERKTGKRRKNGTPRADDKIGAPR